MLQLQNARSAGRWLWLVPVLAAGLVLATATGASAQSQAINGTIEGTIADASGAVLPGVTVTVTNTETGAQRVVISNASGVYRAPLLPLGLYKVSAELDGFKRFERGGIVLTAGEAAVVNVSLEVGQLTEVVSVTADTPIVDAGKIDQGRVLNEREIKTLPLTSRNPYNLALLQPGVVGFETQEFGVPRLTVNGALLRVNYQVDGNNNTQKDRAGLRQMPMSEVMIREVKVITTGYAPEFGQTMGLVYNAITPSGTNTLKGQASYRFQRQPMVAFPFFFQGPKTDERKPPTQVDVFTIDLGGPIIKDRLHYFGGFENTQRDLAAGRVITAKPEDIARLGLAPQPSAIPAVADTNFAIGKIDYTLNAANRLTARYMFFDNFIADNIAGSTGGVPNTVEQGTDFSDRQHSFAVQFVSTLGNNKLNELRLQYATREQGRTPGKEAGTGPAIRVSGVANFGGPIAGTADAGFAFTQNIFQVIDNFTYILGDHSLKAGFDMQWVDDGRTQTSVQFYTFPTIDAYLAAKNGINRRSYTSFQQFFGNANLDYDSTLYGLFVQDDWRLAPNLKLLYGVRYDYYAVPDANPDAPLEYSQDFARDGNNWSPRAGIVWTFGDQGRSVIRANTGLMYDQPLLAAYERALQEDGSTARVNVSVTPTTAGAPDFPNTLENTPPGFVRPAQTISTVDPGFDVARTWQNNVQFEHALGSAYAAGVGFTYVKGWDLPVITNINVINPVSSLADGRPVYRATPIDSTTRLDPRFNGINSVGSIGESTYKALTLQLTRRWSDGYQFDLAYTLGKSEDNAPLTTVLSVQGDAGRMDPSNLDRDLGPHILDQRHTFTGSIVMQPTFDLDNGFWRALLNDNQFGIAMLFASGIPVNVRSNRELNNDGTSSDRPLDVGRNSLNLPARWNVDMRYSRVVPIRGTVKAEVMAELKNLFNVVQWAGVNSTVQTDTAGAPLGPIPTSGDGFPATSGYEQRQLQIGFRLTF